MTAVSSVSSCMHCIRGCIIILLLTILDQGSKSLVLAQLKDQPDISLIPGVLQLRYLENRGMAFGLFEGKIPVFVILCLLFFGVFIYVYARIPKNRYYLPLSVTALVMAVSYTHLDVYKRQSSISATTISPSSAVDCCFTRT